MIRVLIAAGVRFYREGLARALPDVCDVDVVDTPANITRLIAAVREHDPDLVLVDSRMAGGQEISRAARSTSADVRVVVLALQETTSDVLSWAESGACGYVSDAASLHELGAVVRDAADGRVTCGPRIAAGMMERIHDLSSHLRGGDRGDPTKDLTPRELEVAALLVRGRSNKHIARSLGISLSTVKNHVHSILSKLSVDRRGEAADVVRRWGRTKRLSNSSGRS